MHMHKMFRNKHITSTLAGVAIVAAAAIFNEEPRGQSTLRTTAEETFDGLEGAIERTTFNGRDITITSITFDPNLYALHVVSAPDKNLFKLEDAMNKGDYIGGINGGFYESDHTPTGLVVRNGIKTNPLTPKTVCSGVFWLDSDNNPYIQHTDHFKESPDVVWALQCGPLLVDNGSDRLQGIEMPYGNDFPTRRSVISIDNQGNIQLSVIDPIGLHDLSAFMATRSEYALNLDGGPSSRIFLDDNGDTTAYGSNYVTKDFLMITKANSEE